MLPCVEWCEQPGIILHIATPLVVSFFPERTKRKFPRVEKQCDRGSMRGCHAYVLRARERGRQERNELALRPRKRAALQSVFGFSSASLLLSSLELSDTTIYEP